MAIIKKLFSFFNSKEDKSKNNEESFSVAESYPETVIVKDTPCYPPKPKGIKVSSVDEIFASQYEKFILPITQILGLSLEETQNYFFPVIKKYIEFVHLLPASREDHHHDLGGLFYHGLETCFYGIKYSESYMPYQGDDPKHKKHYEERWRFSVAISCLLHDIAKPLTDIIVTNNDGTKQWNPFVETLYEWTQNENIDYYYICYVKNRNKKHEEPELISSIVSNLLNRQVIMYITQYHKEIMTELLASFNPSNTNNVLRNIMIKADTTSVRKDVTTPVSENSAAYGVSTTKMFISVLRDLLLEHEHNYMWDINNYRSNVYFSGEEILYNQKKYKPLYIAWEQKIFNNEFYKIVEEEKDNLEGFPRSIFALADRLTDKQFLKGVDLNNTKPEYISIVRSKDKTKAINFSENVINKINTDISSTNYDDHQALSDILKLYDLEIIRAVIFLRSDLIFEHNPKQDKVLRLIKIGENEQPCIVIEGGEFNDQKDTKKENIFTSEPKTTKETNKTNTEQQTEIKTTDIEETTQNNILVVEEKTTSPTQEIKEQKQEEKTKPVNMLDMLDSISKPKEIKEEIKEENKPKEKAEKTNNHSSNSLDDMLSLVNSSIGSTDIFANKQPIVNEKPVEQKNTKTSTKKDSQSIIEDLWSIASQDISDSSDDDNILEEITDVEIEEKTEEIKNSVETKIENHKHFEQKEEVKNKENEKYTQSSVVTESNTPKDIKNTENYIDSSKIELEETFTEEEKQSVEDGEYAMIVSIGDNATQSKIGSKGKYRKIVPQEELGLGVLLGTEKAKKHIQTRDEYTDGEKVNKDQYLARDFKEKEGYKEQLKQQRKIEALNVLKSSDILIQRMFAPIINGEKEIESNMLVYDVIQAGLIITNLLEFNLYTDTKFTSPVELRSYIKDKNITKDTLIQINGVTCLSLSTKLTDALIYLMPTVKPLPKERVSNLLENSTEIVTATINETVDVVKVNNFYKEEENDNISDEEKAEIEKEIKELGLNMPTLTLEEIIKIKKNVNVVTNTDLKLFVLLHELCAELLVGGGLFIHGVEEQNDLYISKESIDTIVKRINLEKAYPPLFFTKSFIRKNVNNFQPVVGQGLAIYGSCFALKKRKL